MNEKPKVLNYLIKRVKNKIESIKYLKIIFLIFFFLKWPSIDINDSCDSGNTALHAAVNKGNLELVDILLQSLNHDHDDEKSKHSEQDRKIYRLDIDKPNPKCMNATALHLAVWNDFNEIAIKLIQAKADPNLKMNDTSTTFDLAKENSNDVLHDLLVEYFNMNNRTNE